MKIALVSPCDYAYPGGVGRHVAALSEQFRAEGLHVECTVGLMARPERVVALAIGLLLGPAITPWALALLAITTWGTVLQRIVHVWQETDGAQKMKAPRAPLWKRKRVTSS